MTVSALMQTLTPDEETCDPMTRNCQTPMHVWETKCTSCYGSGEASSISAAALRYPHTMPVQPSPQLLLGSLPVLLCRT